MDLERWQRLSPLLDALLELPEEDRPAHLHTLRQEDPALADELAQLLKLDASDTPIFESPMRMLSGIAMAGARLGPYRLERLLGEGGMGQVWLAERADGLYERKVALKLLRPGLLDPSLRQRFDREREILARFSHSYIAHLLDAGIDQNGQPYLALEHVEGEPITSWCRARQLDIAARLDLFRQVCDAVSHAHANLIVHRDLKPSNILVTPAGQVRLLDFGIAKLLDVQPLPIEQTRTGVRAFTLHYAAPEQIRNEPVTTMTDVYSLGVVLYELLTGSYPYQLKRQTDAEWEEAILTGEPLRPSLAAARAEPELITPYSPHRLARALAGDLDNILLKALAKQPERRYVSVEALSQDLLSYLRGQPVRARGESLSYRFSKYLRRHRWTISAGLAILGVLTFSLAVVAWQAQRALQEANRAQAMQRFVAELFQDAGSSANTPIDLRSLLDMGILRGEHSLARQPQARAELYGVVAQLRLGLGDYREAKELLLRQAKLLEQLPQAPASLRLEAATLRGDVDQQLGDTATCIRHMQPLSETAKVEEQRLTQPVTAFYVQLGRCQRLSGEAKRAQQLFERAQNLRKVEKDNVGVAETKLELAALQFDTAQLGAAIQTLDQGLTQLRKNVGDHHPLAIDLLRARCKVEHASDALEAAVRDCRASLQLAQELNGRNHRTTIDANSQLAALYINLGRFAEAESILLDTSAWMRARLDAHHPELARTYTNLGVVAWERGDIPRALRYLRQARAAWQKNNNLAQVAELDSVLAQVLHNAGMDREALPLAQASFNLRQDLPHAIGPTGDSQRLIGVILNALGQSSRAEAALTTAVLLTRNGYGTTSAHTRKAEIALAWFQAQQQHSETALLQLDRFSQPSSTGLEQHKNAWLARAFAANIRCQQPEQVIPAQQALDSLLSEMLTVLPEGGMLQRKVQAFRNHCGR